MTNLITSFTTFFERIEAMLSGWFLQLAARLVFAGVLFVYFWKSGLTKLGEGFVGIFRPSDGAYFQIFPKAIEAAGYDTSQLGFIHWAIALAGTWAELLLPILIVLGLMTRLAALGMIGFIFVQSWVDVFGHLVGPEDIGTWFDNTPSALIVDQRAFWVLALLILVVRGAGALSLDRLIAPKGVQHGAE